MSVVVEIQSLSKAGLNKRQIAARLGIHRETVAKYLGAEGAVPRRERRVGNRKVDRFMGHMEGRLEKFPELSAEQLHRERRKQGYAGSARTVRRAVARLRERKGGTIRRYRANGDVAGRAGPGGLGPLRPDRVKTTVPLWERTYRCEACGRVLDRPTLLRPLRPPLSGVARRPKTPVEGT